MIYTLPERVQIVKWNYGGNSIQGTINLFTAAFENRPIPANRTIRRIIMNLETKGCLTPTMHKKLPRVQVQDEEQIEGDELSCEVDEKPSQYNMVYTLSEKVQIIKWFYGGHSIKATIKLFKEAFENRPQPSASTILRITNNLENKGCLTPTMHMRAPRVPTYDETKMRRDEMICACVEKNPNQSYRQLAQQFNVAQMTVSRILKRNGYFPDENFKKKIVKQLDCDNSDEKRKMAEVELSQIKKEKFNCEDEVEPEATWLSSSVFEFINCEDPIDSKCNEIGDSDSSYKCGLCSEDLATKEFLALHMKTHTGQECEESDYESRNGLLASNDVVIKSEFSEEDTIINYNEIDDFTEITDEKNRVSD